MLTKEVEKQKRKSVEGESSALDMLEISGIVRIWKEMGSLSGGGIGAREQVQWEMGLVDRGGHPWKTGSGLRGWSRTKD